MAKKNTITFSVIIVVIVIAYVWLTGPNQWGTNRTATNQTNVPLENNRIDIDEQVYYMDITALIPPSETFERIIEDLPMTTSINVHVEYVEQSDLSYQNYINFLLTKESGDIHLIPNEWVLPLAVQGYLMPLDRVVTTEYIEEQTPALVESMKWNSSIWAAPYQLDPYIVLPHQSIAAYFSKTEMEVDVGANEEIGEQEIEAIDTELQVEVEEEPVKEDKSNNENLVKYNAIQVMLSEMSANKILLNLEGDTLDQLYHFLYYIERHGITSGEVLSNEQIAMLTRLRDNPSLISDSPLVELLNDDANQPMFIILKWSELSKHIALIEQYYSIENIEVPIYWTNGYSFVIKQQTKQHQIAGQWIEALHRKISQSHITNVGMPIHRSNLSRLQADWQKRISEQFMQQFNTSSAMIVNTKWPTYYEQLHDEWNNLAHIVDQIDYWLSYLQHNMSYKNISLYNG